MFSLLFLILANKHVGCYQMVDNELLVNVEFGAKLDNWHASGTDSSQVSVDQSSTVELQADSPDKNVSYMQTVDSSQN